LRHTFKECTDHAEILLTLGTQNKAQLQTQRDDILKEIRRIKTDMIQLLNDLETSAVMDVEGVHKTTVLELDDKMASCQQLHDAVKKSSTYLQTVMSNGSDCQIFQTLQTLQKQCPKYDITLQSMHMSAREFQYTFTMQSQLETLMTSLKELGKVDVMRVQADLPSCPSSRKRKAEKVLDFNARMPEDTGTCNCVGVAYTPSGQIVLADHSNGALKLFSETGQPLHRLKLSSQPWGVAVVNYNGTIAAVTLPDEKRVQLVSLGSTISTAGSINSADMCYGITCVGETLVVGCADDTSLKVMSLDGQEQAFISKTDANGTQLFDSAYYITSKHHGMRNDPTVYVSDGGAGTVVAIKLDGRVACTYTSNSSSKSVLHGVSCDDDGNVYIASHSDRRILQLSSDGQEIGVLLDKELFQANIIGLAFDRKQHHMAVTMYVCDTVNVFRLV
jgi:hypothetical protein